jgi:hypothetical protein
MDEQNWTDAFVGAKVRIVFIDQTLHDFVGLCAAITLYGIVVEGKFVNTQAAPKTKRIFPWVRIHSVEAEEET